MPPSREQRLWTISIRGSSPFSFQARGNPAFEHEGGVSVAHLVLDQGEVGQLKIQAAAAGLKCEAWPMEGQTEEQSVLRRENVGIGAEERVWPCFKCPSCPWVDPRKADPCGLGHLPEESIDALARYHNDYQKAMLECPVRGEAEAE